MNKKYNVGCVPGKFLPPHVGHILLIKKACELCKKVYVVIAEDPNVSKEKCKATHNKYFGFEVRKKWLQKELAEYNNIVFLYFDESGFEAFPKGLDKWSKALKDLVGEKIDAKFVGEESYRELNEKYFPESKLIVVDRKEDSVDISATKIRKDTEKLFDYIVKPAQIDFCSDEFVMRREKSKVIKWIKDYFEVSKFASGVVLGMSGGKDSLVVASLCAEAIGKDKVFGAILPCGVQKDLDDAIACCKAVGIDYAICNIEKASTEIENVIKDCCKSKSLNKDTTINIKPRLRTTILYAIAREKNSLVANTSNLSEKIAGYSTKWGDNVGDFAPLASFTKSEVVELGLALNLPSSLVKKVPADGLSGKTDEDNLGFLYDELDLLIRTGEGKANFKEMITKKYNANKHKHTLIAAYQFDRYNYFEGK